MGEEACIKPLAVLLDDRGGPCPAGRIPVVPGPNRIRFAPLFLLSTMPPARDCLPRTPGATLVLGLSVLQFAVLIGSNVALFVEPSAGTGSIASVIAGVFILYFSIEACWKKNLVQVVALYAFQTCVLVYLALLFAETKAKNIGVGATGGDSYSSLSLVLVGLQLGVMAIGGQLGLAVAGWLAWKEWGWSIYEVIGTDPGLVKAYRAYHIYLCLLKLSWFFVLYEIIEGFGASDGVWYLSPFFGLIIGVVIFVILVLEWVGLRWEKRWLLWTLLVFNIAANAWLALTVVGLDIDVSTYNAYNSDAYSYSNGYSPYYYNSNGEPYTLPPLKYSTIVFTHYVFLTYLARFILSCVNWHWLGRGIYTYNVQNQLQQQTAMAMQDRAPGMATQGTALIPGPAYEGVPLGEMESGMAGYEGGGEGGRERGYDVEGGVGRGYEGLPLGEGNPFESSEGISEAR